jgi:hypothetical protein
MLGAALARTNARTAGAWFRVHKIRLAYDWRRTGTASGPRAGGHEAGVVALSWKQWLLVPLLLPSTLVAIQILDLLTILAQAGLHLKLGSEILDLTEYYTGRMFLQAVLSTATQAVFQSVLFAQGTSRATRIYVDRRIFLTSVITSLVSLLVQVCAMYYEMLAHSLSIATLIKWRTSYIQVRPVMLNSKLETSPSESKHTGLRIGLFGKSRLLKANSMLDAADDGEPFLLRRQESVPLIAN